MAALAMLVPAHGPASAADPSLPNIVIFLIDDAAPLDGRLWGDATLTPTVTNFFVGHGTHFSNAIGETSVCCPGRSGLLTGLHTQNHGVITNDGRLFNAREHLGHELKAVGYETMWVGKYMNLTNKFASPTWKVHGAGWTYLDAIIGENGKYFDYTVHTKTGNVRYGNVHSTRMAAERTVQRLRSVPASKPVFSVVSMYNMHVPNEPMPGFEDDPRWAACADMPPWNPPSYNEADVSDKPAYIRSFPLLPYPDGYPMDGYCREMLGIDWATKTVIDELRNEGRLENSLLIFTADNGVTWGEHRVGRKKFVPYSSPVPLYMWWPARWTNIPRDIDDLVSNIDIAPTLCAIAGCQMGPFPTGQQHSDGVNLLPLLDGDQGHLARTAVLESVWENDVRNWRGVRTAANDPLGAWHYVEWAGGEEELYDLTADPWELVNLANQSPVAAVQSELDQKLAALLGENTTRRPDGSIKRTVGGLREMVGDGLYEDSPAAGQTWRKKVDKSLGANFEVRIDNDGGLFDSFKVTCKLSGVPYAAVDFTSTGAKCADNSVSSSYTITSLAPHATRTLTFRISLPSGLPPGAEAQVVVSIQSKSNTDRVDAVYAVAYK